MGIWIGKRFQKVAKTHDSRIVQQVFRIGYHYKPTIEEAEQGLALLEGLKEQNPAPRFVKYPDLRQIKIID